MSQLEDRFAIQDVLHRYARGVDRLDYDLIASSYFPDAVDNHGGYVGDVPGMIEDIKARHQTIDSSQHLVMNILIEFNSANSAAVESHWLVYLRQRRADGQTRQSRRTIRARLLDRFERRDGRWGIAGRLVVFEEAVDEDITDLVDPGWIRSTRDRTDPLYAADH